MYILQNIKVYIDYTPPDFRGHKMSKNARIQLRTNKELKELINSYCCENNLTITEVYNRGALEYILHTAKTPKMIKRGKLLQFKMDSLALYDEKSIKNRCRYWYINAFSSIMGIARVSINSGCGVNMMQVKKMIREEMALFNTFPIEIQDEMRDLADKLQELKSEIRIKNLGRKTLGNSGFPL